MLSFDLETCILFLYQCGCLTRVSLIWKIVQSLGRKEGRNTAFLLSMRRANSGLGQYVVVPVCLFLEMLTIPQQPSRPMLLPAYSFCTVSFRCSQWLLSFIKEGCLDSGIALLLQEQECGVISSSAIKIF